MCTKVGRKVNGSPVSVLIFLIVFLPTLTVSNSFASSQRDYSGKFDRLTEQDRAVHDQSTGSTLARSTSEVKKSDINHSLKFTLKNTVVKDTASDKSITNSLLVSGYWYKIKVTTKGIYKLTYNDIVGMGFSNPANIRVYGNGGKQLSYWNDDPRPVDLTQIPIYMNKGNDGIFNQDDYILFYAEGPIVWDLDSADQFFTEKIHSYTDGICYFLTTSLGPAKLIESIDNRALSENVNVTTYTDYAYYEKEKYNLINSGRNWYSARIDGSPFDTTFLFSNHDPNSPIRVKVNLAGRSKTDRPSFLYINDNIVDTTYIPHVDFGYSWFPYAKEGSLGKSFLSSNESVSVKVAYEKIDFSDECYLDKIILNTYNKLILENSPFYFRNLNAVHQGNIAKYTLQQAYENIQVWDVSNINSVFAIRGEFSGGNYVFKSPADQLHEFVAVDLDYNFPKPIVNSSERWVGKVPNQNLHGLPTYNYIIVSPEVFLEQANRLADFHRSKDQLSVLVITPDLIYNEFSAGTPDVSALRDFFRYQYLRSNASDSLKYVLLLGDGSFDNHTYTKGNTNYILTYESDNSLAPTISHVSDDFFGMLGDGEGEVSGTQDIGIGRLTVAMVDGSDFQARDVVSKIISYDTCKFTDWRRTLCFVADDGYDAGGVNDGHLHMNDANSFANYVEENYTGFEIRKVYCDAYPQVVTSSGAYYPEVHRELINLFNKGILVFCYAGHGSDNQITSEKILQKQDVSSLKNAAFLPLFITATCSFSRYDNVEIDENNPDNIVAKTSAGEAALLNPEGGAIALLTTSRVVYPGDNRNLVLQVLSYLYKKDSKGQPYRLGDVVRFAKNNLGNDGNKYNFVLLGDPAMALAYPKFGVLTDSINHKPVTTLVDTLIVPAFDTLKAYSTVTVSGHICDDDSIIIADFNGYVYPQVYDKKTTITTFGNDNQPPYVYLDQKNLLYKGKATVTNGRFSFSFVVPKDIAYNIDAGKISYYAENGIYDAKGEFREVNIGGTDDNITPDDKGPNISLYMNDERFQDGGITNADPYIYALLDDENGINTSGVGFGHDIIALLDENNTDPYVLNDYYEATVDDYRSGKVHYQLRDMESGDHQLSLKVWDVFNNSSETSVGFVVSTSDGLVVDKLINYPNPPPPGVDYTQFQYSHNSPDEIHKVVLEVFDISGRLMARIERSEYESGFVSSPLIWDMQGSGGRKLSAGVYPYRLTVTTPLGTSSVSQKLIITR
jgi:hypothetical protein